jgi:hypothetical protein
VSENYYIRLPVRSSGASGDLSLYAPLAGATFTGPLTASLGLSGPHGSFGVGNMASGGALRLTSAGSVRARNNADTQDLSVAETNSGDHLFLGTDAAFTAAKQFGVVNVYSTTGGFIYLGNGGTTRLRADSTGITIYTPGDSLTFGYTGAATTGDIRLPDGGAINSAGSIRFIHSGSTVREYDSRLKVWEFPIAGQTTNATVTTLFTFPSGSNGRSYTLNYRLQAQSATTTGSISLNGYGHFERSAGAVTLRANSSTVVWRSASTMSGSLSGSAGDILVTGTGLGSETFNWRGFVSVQECG